MMRITERLRLIKLTVLGGLLLSVLLSLNLWAGQRWFPKVPAIEGFYGLYAPYDFVYLAVLLLLIFVCFFSSARAPVWILILFGAYLCVEDQNRLQPWFVNYLFILLILQFYKHRMDQPNNFTSVFISLQVLVALIYIYSGIQKLNPFFVTDTFTWMIDPLRSVLSDKQMSLFYRFGNVVPYIELLTGIGLLFRPARFIALPLIIAMHVFILLMLGPAGRSVNYVVWPWNLVMIVLCLLLYGNTPTDRFFDVSFLIKHLPFYMVLLVMLVLPFFSLNNKYDSYLSSSLYSGNTNGCKLILSDTAYNRLPLYLRAFVTRDADYNLLYVKHWAMTELNAPCVPEHRIFENVQKRVILLTRTGPNDVRLDYTERKKILDF